MLLMVNVVSQRGLAGKLGADTELRSTSARRSRDS